MGMKEIKEQFDDIMNDIVNGISLAKSLESKKLGRGSFFELIKKEKDLADKYTRAKEVQSEFLASDIISISDDLSIDPTHKKIMVDSRKWYASKVLPKLYGEKVEHTGEVTTNMIMPTVKINGKELNFSVGEEIDEK